jgi:TolA-binding protein
MSHKGLLLSAALVMLGLGFVTAQGDLRTTAGDTLRKGIQLLANGDYPAALSAFDALLLDSDAGQLRAEGAYWAIMTHLAAANPALAEQAIETFFEAFPKHPRIPELRYQKARAAFIQKHYERSLREFQAYISLNPEGEHLPAAIFWSAEALYFLGRLSESEKLYKALMERYPGSSKEEASNYRLSLIQFKYREDELLTLLKWSHEESLRIIEEFQRREKAYEQAIAVYQRRYGEVRRDIEEAQMSLEDQLIALKTNTDQLTRRIQEKDAQIAELEKRLATSERSQQEAIATVESLVSAPAAPVASTGTKTLLSLKERVLVLVEYYLELLVDMDQPGRSN